MRPGQTPRIFIALPALLAVFSAGCASSGADYPSLAIRDAERAANAEPAPTRPEPVAMIPASVLAQVDDALSSAKQAQSSFAARAPAARTTIEGARRATVGSDRWAGAQVALSELDSLRASTAVALGELDVLYAARAVELERRDAIDAARDEVATILARQDSVLNSLKPLLAQ